PGSIILQFAEQPSPAVVLPSSHVSLEPRRPSPQTPAMLQTLGVPVQVHPAGTWQIMLQPSPAFLLPSSHDSPSSSTPLPHLAGSPTSIVGMSGRAPSVLPIPPLPPLPPPSAPLPVTVFGVTPAQLAMTKDRATAPRERRCPLRIGGLLGWVRTGRPNTPPPFIPGQV